MNFRTGLIVPTVTALNERGELIIEDQRRLLRHCLQSTCGAAAIFSPSTTGEFLHLRNDQRIRLMELSMEAIAAQAGKGEAWPVINGDTASETLENLKAAIALGVHRVVLAPLAISDLTVENVPAFVGSVASVVQDKNIPICLYENPDISVHSECSMMPADILRVLCKIPQVTGIKISAGINAVVPILSLLEELNREPPVAVYVGHELSIFSLDLDNPILEGIVAGTGNLMPREWNDAWKACLRADKRQMTMYKNVFEILDKAVCGKFISAIKWGLWHLGIFSSRSATAATPKLTEEEGEAFLARFKEVRALLSKEDMKGI